MVNSTQTQIFGTTSATKGMGLGFLGFVKWMYLYVECENRMLKTFDLTKTHKGVHFLTASGTGIPLSYMCVQSTNMMSWCKLNTVYDYMKQNIEEHKHNTPQQDIIYTLIGFHCSVDIVPSNIWVPVVTYIWVVLG